MLSLLGFLAILGPLVIVHELGHYLFARLFNVKAEVFSIGFGPRIAAKQIGETEWRVAAIPLGGFVKLLGEEPDRELTPEEQSRSLQKQPPWKRFFIFFGGPLFNFLFAILVFMAILVIGEPQLASVIGRVVEGSAADQAGFRSGDAIVAVDGKPVRKWDDVTLAVNESPNRAMNFELKRGDQTVTLAVTPKAEEGFSVYGEETHVGGIDGLVPHPRANTVGISSQNSPAGKAGLQTGDKIIEANGAAVSSWEQLESVYAALPVGSEFKLKVESGKDIVLTKATDEKMGVAWGLFSTELFVEKAVDDSPAQKAGIQRGDRLVGIGPLEVKSFFELREAVQKSGEKDGKVELRWERAGELKTAVVEPTAKEMMDPAMRKVKQFTVGVMPIMSLGEPATVIERTWNPFLLVYRGTERMVIFTWRNVVSISKMFTGDVSVNTLGGPILIGKIAGESISRGLTAFLSTMAILSVGLGVLNVLPIPVLDGGHLLLLGIEAIRRKPLTIRQMEIVQQVGLSLILLLMVVVIRNDIARLPFFN